MQEVGHAIKKGSNNKCTFSREGPQNIDLIRLKKALNWKKNKKGTNLVENLEVDMDPDSERKKKIVLNLEYEQSLLRTA